MNKLNVLTEIKGFLDGYNNELKYLVNVETNPDDNFASCIIHEPSKEPEIRKVQYTPFMYMKDLSLLNMKLYAQNEYILENKKIQYGITITQLKTGNQNRLKNGFCYKISSYKSYNAIINFLRDGGVYPYEKVKDDYGNDIKDAKGESIYKNRDKFYSPKTTEQFFISTQSRLFKGVEEYKNVHKVTFDIETTGLRFQICRTFAIGVRDNRGFEIILEVEKDNDDESEIKLIQDFFNLINYLRPAILSGYNSEEFDFEFILGRAKILGMDLTKLPTTLKDGISLKRRPNVSVKYGNTADKFTATEMWGISVIDILHAVKKTAAVNTEIKENKLKYIAKHEKIAKPNRTYIPGEDGNIGKYYKENKVFVINSTNNYLIVPDEFQEVARKLYGLQTNKSKVSDGQYKEFKIKILSENKEFVKWFRENALVLEMSTFIGGKNLVKQYLLDDLWETEQVDELYNQSAFMLSKIVPTTFQRVCTMGTAAIWNLLLTAWSYENDLAIPHSDIKEHFSGGLARCFKVGYSTRIVKIDYASLYPMLQLTWNIFPMFDITGVIKKMLLYLTTTRNIYKKLANSDKLNNDEIALLKEIDHDVYNKLMNNEITDVDRAMFKVKQLPIKILNNSLFGALGSDISFNWSDNVCASRITCNGRLMLRQAISWFTKYNCIALLAVTDGINFQIPEKTTIRITDTKELYDQEEGLIEDMWHFGNEKGITALIDKYNSELKLYNESFERGNYLSVDNDGEYLSCLNLSRINYATLSLVKDKKSGTMKEKVKLTGNTIKSKVMPVYIEEFFDKGLDLILHGKGSEFVEYYYDYVEDIYYKRIPLSKIASKNKIKCTLNAYKKRGKDKNGREKGMQAHMELLIERRNKTINELFELHKSNLVFVKAEEKLTIDDKLKLIANHMPAEPELDSVVYTVNTGYLKSHGSSNKIVDKVTGEERYASTLISAKDLAENPNMTGDYNIVKYLDAFNSRVGSILVGFDPEVAKTMLSKIVKVKTTDEFGNKKIVQNISRKSFTKDELILKNFDSDTFDESMYLENKEVEFWNKTGYDPRLVWNGFNMYDNDKVYFEIYEGALNHLNNLMINAKKPLIKSINDKYEKNDFVLIKDGSSYYLGVFNGIYISIIKQIFDIPKSEIEIELDLKKIEEDKKIQNLEITLTKKTDKDIYLEAMIAKRIEFFEEFKTALGSSAELTLEQLYEQPDGISTLDEFIKYVEENEKLNNNLNDDGDGEY